MKIIDSHIHTNLRRKEFIELARKNNINFSLEGLKNEMQKNNVDGCVSITDHFEMETPIGFDELKQQCLAFNKIIPCVGINPLKITRNSLKRIEEGIIKKEIKAVKIYLGYYLFYATDKIYHPFYILAEKYNIPVIFHTGDTFSKNGKLKYSMPLIIDEIAVDFPNTKFIIAHLGNPWIEDAAEVIYKNPNVYADLSGMFIGNYTEELVKKVRNAFDYVENPNKFLYGSDWPICSNMQKYIRFVKKCIPKKYHNLVFYQNALNLFTPIPIKKSI